MSYRPPAPPTRNAGLWQIALALFVLYLIMEYVPDGEKIGWIILIGTLLATPAAADAFARLLHFIETGG
jgi:hypothetical protein